jgi:hypothetical protein
MNMSSIKNVYYAYMYPDEIEKAYKEKFGVSLRSSWGGNCILGKNMKKKFVFMSSGLKNDKVREMMENGLKMGTNYLEDCLLAAGKKWAAKNPGLVSGGRKL